MKIFLVFLCLGSLLFSQKNPQVVLETSLGKIVLEIYQDKAPETAKNFLKYVDEKFYDGTIFHRVIPNFVIQGGGLTKDMVEKDTYPAIKNEADNGLSNLRGTVAMARTMDPHSATSQFFINLVDNKRLDFKSRDNGKNWGYAVFGKVIEGMEVVDKIASVPTTTKGFYENVPKDPVIIIKAYRKK